MNLRNQLRSLDKDFQRLKKMKASNMQCKNEWKEVDEHLSQLLIRDIKRFGTDDGIFKIDLASHVLALKKKPDGTWPKIQPEDMIFFCSFHKLKLHFLVDYGNGVFESKKYIPDYTQSYIIRI